ncbi:MAG: nuclear transport factor 2 family protein [Pseudomonadales bacterium]|nr:nuclear transport factor 2 family protein [Pseudomonadales bacterium]MCP5184956.1 nuclear transport factor 2 family protein [Pseudomonadales bacterium]
MNTTHAEFANEAFYLAFEAKDTRAMNAVWAQEHAIVCLHPGATPLVGREAVMASWQAILDNPNQGAVSCYGARGTLIAPGVCAVTCYELAGDATMIATNIFVEEGGRPRLVFHQAGWCADPPPPP